MSLLAGLLACWLGTASARLAQLLGAAGERLCRRAERAGVAPTRNPERSGAPLPSLAQALRPAAPPPGAALEQTWQLTEASPGQKLGVVALGVANLVGVGGWVGGWVVGVGGGVRRAGVW